MFILHPILFTFSNVYSTDKKSEVNIKTYGTFLVSSNFYNNEIIYADVFPKPEDS